MSDLIFSKRVKSFIRCSISFLSTPQDLNVCKSDSCRRFLLPGSDSMPTRCQLIVQSQCLIMSVNKANYPYKEAILSDAKGDLKKGVVYKLLGVVGAQRAISP